MKKLRLVLFLLLAGVASSSALTLSEIRDQIRLRIKDSNTSRQRYTDTQLNTLINEAHRDVVNATWVILNSTSITLVSGTTYYSLPSDTIDIARVTFDYVPLKETTFQDRDAQTPGSWETSGGRPSRYYQDPTQPGYIGFQPFPNSVTSTGTIRIQYYAQANDLSDDTDEPFNGDNRYVPYHDLLVFFPCYKIFLLENEIPKAQAYAQEYESRVILMRDRVRSKPNYFPGFSGTPH